MRELNWSRHPHGWRADPFLIEKLAPRFFVLSRQRKRRVDQIAGTSPTLAYLKYRAGCMAKRRIRLRIAIRRALVLTLFLAAMTVASQSTGSLAAAILIGSALGAWVAVLRLADVWFSRASDSLGDVYQ